MANTILHGCGQLMMTNVCGLFFVQVTCSSSEDYSILNNDPKEGNDCISSICSIVCWHYL